MNEFDCLMAGIGGGMFGSILVLWVAQFHWRRLTIEYKRAHEQISESIKLAELQSRINDLELIVRGSK